MKAKQDTVIKEREKRIAQRKAEKEQKKQEELEAKRAEKELQKKQIRALSFLGDEEEEEEEEESHDHEDKGKDSTEDDDSSNEQGSSQEGPNHKKRKIGKNPDVDTSFLPDREREKEENQLREILRQVPTKIRTI